MLTVEIPDAVVDAYDLIVADDVTAVLPGDVARLLPVGETAGEWAERLSRFAGSDAVESLVEYAALVAAEARGWVDCHPGEPLPVADLHGACDGFAWDLIDAGYDDSHVDAASRFVNQLLGDADAIEGLLDTADRLDGDPDGYEILVGPDGAPGLVRWAPDGGLVVDCFAGPGGWSEGLAELGVRDVGFEWDEWACATRAAAGHATIRADVASWPLGPLQGRVWGLVSSPPCPSWSAAGKKLGRATDDGALIDQVIVWAEALRPVWVAAEQVPTRAVRDVFESHAARLRDLGYRARVLVVNAADYGVPQTRKRCLLLAHRNAFADPVESHAKDPTLDGRRPWVSMAEALGWGLTARPSLTVCSQRAGSGLRFEGGSGARSTLAREQQAGRWRARVGRTGEWLHPADEAAANGSGRLGRPSPAELGVLQGFRADYPWQGPVPGHWRAYAQVGNAVPPAVAAAAVAPLLRA